VDDAAFGLRAESGDEFVEIQSAQEFHRVVEDAFRRVAVVVNLDRVGMSELAGKAHFAFEALDRLRVGAVGQEQFDSRIASHERVARPVNDSHAAFPDLLLQRVLAQLPELEFGFAQAPAPRDVEVGKHEHAGRTEHQQQHQDDEKKLDHAQWLVSFAGVNLRGDTEAELWQPAPRADYRNAAIIARRCRVHSASANDRIGHDVGQWPDRGSRVLRLELLRQIISGIPQAQVQSGAGSGTVFDQSQFLELIVKPASGNHQAVLV